MADLDKENKEEALQEAARNYGGSNYTKNSINASRYNGFIAGAKWQARTAIPLSKVEEVIFSKNDMQKVQDDIDSVNEGAKVDKLKLSGFPDTTELTEKESAALLKTVQLWEAILQLKNEHPDFIQEARFHIHALQNMIAARPVLRKLTA